MADEETLALVEAEAEAGLEPLVFEHFENEPKKVRSSPRLSAHQITEKIGTQNSDYIVRQEKTKARLANREIIRRLSVDPGSFSKQELNFIAGTAVDKVAKKERWERAGDGGAQGWAEKFVETFSRIQGEIALTLTVSRPPPREKNVTPGLTFVSASATSAEDDGFVPER